MQQNNQNVGNGPSSHPLTSSIPINQRTSSIPINTLPQLNTPPQTQPLLSTSPGNPPPWMMPKTPSPEPSFVPPPRNPSLSGPIYSTQTAIPPTPQITAPIHLSPTSLPPSPTHLPPTTHLPTPAAHMMPTAPSPEPRISIAPSRPEILATDHTTPSSPAETISSVSSVGSGITLSLITKIKLQHRHIMKKIKEKRANVDKESLYAETMEIAVLPVVTNDPVIMARLTEDRHELANVLKPKQPTTKRGIISAHSHVPLELPDNMVMSFAKAVHSKQTIFAQTAQHVNDPRIQIFSKSLKFVSFILNSPSFDPSRLTSFRDLLVLVADATSKEIRNLYPDYTPEEHDLVFMQVMDLYISTAREAIYSVNPNSALVGHPDIKAYKPHVTRFLKSADMMKDEDIEESGQIRMADWVRLIFNKSAEKHNQGIAEAMKLATKKNFILGGKVYLDCLTDAEWQDKRSQDFPNRQSFDTWRQLEFNTTNMVMNTVVAKWPEGPGYMALPVPPRDTGRLLLPEAVPQYYRALLALCVAHDAPAHPQELLANPTKQLLVEVGVRWRISPQFHMISFAEVTLNRFIHSPADMRLPNVLKTLTKCICRVEAEYGTAKTEELEAYLAMLVKAEKTLRSHLLNHFGDALSTSGPNTGSANDVYAVIDVLALIYDDIVFQKSNVSAAKDLLEGNKQSHSRKSVATMEELLLEAINRRYNELNDSIAGPDGREISRMILLAKSIRKEINSYIWRFPEAVLGEIDVPALASRTYLKYFVLEMENTRHNPDMQKGNYTIAEMLELYQIVRVLRDFVGLEHADSALASFDIEGWFEPFVGKWLSLTDAKLDEWVGASVAIDTWQPVLPPNAMHSSSVVDIFASFHQTLDFIDQLRWPNEVTKGGFLCKFAKNISKAVHRFTEYVIDPFKQIAVANLSPDVPIDISPETCVRINDLLEAYYRLEDLVDNMDIPHYSYLFTPTLGAGRNRGTGSRGKAVEYSIEVVRAVELVSITDSVAVKGPGAMDYFVTLTMAPHGSMTTDAIEVGRTPMVAKCISGDPNWQKRFPIVSRPQDNGNVEVEVMLWAKPSDGLVKREESIGGARLLLSSTGLPPEGRFSEDAVLVPNLDDFLTQEITLPLDIRDAKLILRITRENPEADVRTDNDMRFWAVRTAIFLETALIDSIRILVETIVRYARRQYVIALRNSGEERQDIEGSLSKVLSYLDRCFGIINMYTDPKVGDWVADHFGVIDGKQEGMEPVERIAAAPPPNSLILFIWSEFIKAIHDTADAVDSMATSKKGLQTLIQKYGGRLFGTDITLLSPQEVEARRRRFAACYLTGIEYVKSLMYGDVEGYHYGFDVPLLETEDYTSLISLLRVIAEGRGKQLATASPQKSG